MRQIRPAGLIVSVWSLLAILLLPSPSAAQAGCGPLPAPTGRIIDVSAAQAGSLRSIVASAQTGDTIRLANGTYALSERLVFRTPGVTLRSASGNRDDVILDGQYQAAEVISAMASNITVADVTVMRAYYHPIHVSPYSGNVTGTLLHNLRVVDGAEQFVKVNNVDDQYVDNGIVRCSSLELTDVGRAQVRNSCYTGGIDIHQARGWQIYANRFDGFWCASGLSEHAIHVWTGSRDTLVDRNVIINSVRGIGFGLGSTAAGRTYPDQPCNGRSYVGHYNGVITNNFVFANDPDLFDSQYGFDTGIGLEQACGAKVLHNTVFSTRAPVSSSIEWRFPNTAASIANNLVSHNLVPRDAGIATLTGNVTGAPASLFVNAAAGDLHLRPTASAAMDLAVAISTPVPWDIDGQPRGAPADVGADEYSAAAELLPPSGLTVASLVGNTVTLSWAAPNGGVTPTEYVVEGGTSPGAVLASLPTGGLTPTISFVAPSGIYYVRVHAMAGGTKSAASNEVQLLVNVAAPPAAPTGLLGLANGDQLSLTWRNAAGGSAATGVMIDVSGAANSSIPLALSDSFSFGGVPPGTYAFAVRAFNGSGPSGPSNTVTLTFPGSCAAPQTPVNFSATRAGNVISVSWAPALNGAAPTGFRLIVSGTYSLEVPIAGRSISAPVEPGTYTLSVAATNPCGTSTPTAAQTVTLP
jgi:hypothetical protein